MILPHSNTMILVLMIVSMFCWGSWANTFKLAGKWRYELYYFDFAFGLLLFALIYAFTMGNLGYDGFGFIDSAMNAGKREWMYAVAAGIVFNFANILLLAAISAAGMALAFPAALGTALVVGVLLNSVASPSGNALYLSAGCLLVMGAILADATGHSALGRLRHEALAKAGKAKSTRRPSDLKGIMLALVSGLLMVCLPPLLQKATAPDIGLGPYALCVFFGAGVLAATFALGMFLLNLSMQGEELSISAYFNSTPKQHILGLAGGGLWCTGAVAIFVAIYANTAPGSSGGLPAGATPVGQAPGYAVAQSAALLAALWGILVWKERKDGDFRVKLMTALTLILFAGGVALIALAPASAAAK
jgi:glucose uptake protein